MNIKNWLIRTYLKFKIQKKLFVKLNKADSEQLLEILNNPPEPNQRLIDAGEHYKSENVINLETGASDETWLQRYLSLGK